MIRCIHVLYLVLFLLPSYLFSQINDTVITNDSSFSSISASGPVDHSEILPDTIRTVQCIRSATFPPGYMRREPSNSQPQKGMFLSGSTVRMPTKSSIEQRIAESAGTNSSPTTELEFDTPQNQPADTSHIGRLHKKNRSTSKKTQK